MTTIYGWSLPDGQILWGNTVWLVFVALTKLDANSRMKFHLRWSSHLRIPSGWIITLDHQLAGKKLWVRLTISGYKNVKKLLLYRSKPTKCEVQRFHVKQKRPTLLLSVCRYATPYAVHIYTWHVNRIHIFQKQPDCEYTFLSMHLRFKVMSLHVKLILKRPKSLKQSKFKLVLEDPSCGNRPYIRLPVFGLHITWHHVVKTGKSTLEVNWY